MVDFFSQWAQYYAHPKRNGSPTKNGRRHRLPRSFVRDMRRAALDQERWYIVLHALRSAPVRPRCAPLRTRLIDSWKGFGQTLNLPSEESMQAALRARQAYFCHDPQCLHNVTATGITLKKCRGCGEAYYCSRDCQRR